MRAEPMSRAGRKAQILSLLQSRWCAYTVHGVARALGMKPSPHLRNILYEMFGDGLIGGWKGCKENGKDVYYFYDLDRDTRWGQSPLPGFDSQKKAS